VVFSINGQRYCVSRFLDAQGNHGARLSDQNEAPLARGVESVRQALEALLGFGFDEFIESFYLAQREITTPQPHSIAVKKMAGIAALEQVSVEAKAEIEQEQTVIRDAERAIADIEQLIAELNVDETLLPGLESKRDDLCAQQDKGAKQVAELQARNECYRDAGARITSAMETFCSTEVNTSYPGWRTHVDAFAAHFDELAQQHQGDTTLTRMMEALHDLARGARQRLSGFDKLRDAAHAYRRHLAYMLSEASEAPAYDQGTSEPLGHTQTQLQTRLHTVLGRRARVRIGLLVFLLLALAVWAVWGLLTQMPESKMAQGVAAWLANTVGGGEQTYRSWLLPAAASLSVLFALCAFRSLYLGSTLSQLRRSLHDIGEQIAAARHQAETLDALDGMPLPQAVDVLAACKDVDVSAGARTVQSENADWLDVAKLDHYHAQLRSLRDHCESSLDDQCTAFAAQIKSIQEDMAIRQEQIDPLNEHIAQEQARHQKLNEFKVAITSHEERMAACNHRIRLRELACDLLVHGAQHIAKTFNRDIRRLVSHTLPLLTQGRYEHLKIDANLDVQVFSNEKRDFMQLEEISTGTQRQIMLAVRLALSQEFINTTLGRHQFVFLDEPFAFFDQERTLSALQALPQLSQELSQIWIVAQSFPEGFGFDLHIPCEQDKDTLTVTGA
jgi:DNA repair exonuclease SbcCD ATPase subunit